MSETAPAGFLAVHVGAGYHSVKKREAYQDVCRKACQQGQAILRNGGTATQAAVAASVVLENSPMTNAGIGSNLTLDGAVECDACVMEGSSLLYGAVGAVSGVKNPVCVAHNLLEVQRKGQMSYGRIPPQTLTGKGAQTWARSHGLEMVDPETMVTKSSQSTYTKYKSKLDRYEAKQEVKRQRLQSEGKKDLIVEEAMENTDALQDTVGVVCVDATGAVSAAASSGGIILKHPGRIGQAAVYGCGCWAENTETGGVAVCTSGTGELLIKTMLAKECAMDLRDAEDPTQALTSVMKSKFIGSPFIQSTAVTDRLGGVLALQTHHDKDQHHVEVLWGHTTNTMCLGYAATSYKQPKVIFSTLPEGSTPGQSVVIGSHYHSWNKT